VRTTLPFFRWLVDQAAFRDALFSTTSLDSILATRTEPFVAASEADTRDALTAAGLAAWFQAHRAAVDPASPAGGAWRQAARAESRR
jgi:hypothetical protein